MDSTVPATLIQMNLKTLFNVQCTGGSSAHEEPPRAA